MVASALEVHYLGDVDFLVSSQDLARCRVVHMGLHRLGTVEHIGREFGLLTSLNTDVGHLLLERRGK